jgi:hypothetical protein
LRAPGLSCRYLLQQGYGGREQPDICILTPYVRQLLKLRQAVATVAGLKFVMSEKDETDLGHVITDSTAAGAEAEADALDPAAAASSTSTAGTSSSLGAQGSASTSAGAVAGAGSKVVTLGSSIRIATVDNFQGEESKIIILSLVRNPREAGAGIGFLAVNHRINVLLSR